MGQKAKNAGKKKSNPSSGKLANAPSCLFKGKTYKMKVSSMELNHMTNHHPTNNKGSRLKGRALNMCSLTPFIPQSYDMLVWGD
jgi:hypothetical protein